jgi:serine/threonine-protein kinase
MVTPDRRVKITDFGVARAKGGASLTDTGTIIGTPAYVAPEVAQGAEATPRSDIYGLGVVLYECLTGARPFTRDTPIAVAIAHLQEPPPPLPEHLLQPLRELVMQTLAKDPAERPPSGAVLASQLRQVALAGPGPVAPTQTLRLPPAAYGITSWPADERTPTPTPDGAPPRRRGIAWPLTAAAAAILLVIAAAVAVAGVTDDDGGERDAAVPGTTAPGPTRSPGSKDPSTPTSSAPPSTDTEQSAEEQTSVAEEQDVVFVDEAIYVGQEVKDAEKALKALGLDPTKEELGGDGPRDLVADLSPVGEVPLDTEVTLYVVKAPDSPEGQGPPGPDGNGNGNDDDED